MPAHDLNAIRKAPPVGGRKECSQISGGYLTREKGKGLHLEQQGDACEMLVAAELTLHGVPVGAFG